EQGRQPCSQDANSTRRYAYGSRFMSPIETAAASRRLFSPPAWTPLPMAPGMASAPPPCLFDAIPSRVGFHHSQTRLSDVKSPYTFLRRGIRAGRRPQSWPEGFDSPCLFGGDPVSLGGPEGNDSANPSCASPATSCRSCARPRRKRRSSPTG